MSDTRWNAYERRIAHLLGTRRIPVTGEREIRRPGRRRCWALTAAGRPCRATPRAGAAVCRHHWCTGIQCWGGPLDGRVLLVHYEWQCTIAMYDAGGPDWRLRVLPPGDEPGADVQGVYLLEALPPIGVGPRFCWRALGVTGAVEGDVHRGGGARA